MFLYFRILEILQRHVSADALHDSTNPTPTEMSSQHPIARSIAEMIQAEGQLAALFFFSRTAAKRNHDKCLIATIAYQITQSIPEARSFIEEAVAKDPLVFMKSLSSHWQIRHLIVHPLKNMLAGPHTSSFPMLIVIDGLDECFSGIAIERIDGHS